MNTHFETLETGNEFETASEEFERGYGGGRRSRPGARSGGYGSRTGPRQGPRGGPRPPSFPGHWPRPSRYYGPAVWPAWGGPGPAYQSCMRQCLAAPYAMPEPAVPADPAADAGGDAPSEEMDMQPTRCQCPRCRGQKPLFEFEGESEGEAEFEDEFGAEAESQGEFEGLHEQESEGGAFNEAEEIALAAELLSVSNEAELEQFLGKLWKSVKKVGGAVGQIAKPFSGVLKAVAKKALPFVGGALGSLIPIPGVGTALGTALGSAVSKALEMEFEGLEMEDREFEMARRFVRIAGSAAQQLEPQAEGGAAVQAAVASAAQQHLPHFGNPAAGGGGKGPRAGSGTWTRRGSTLVLSGA